MPLAAFGFRHREHGQHPAVAELGRLPAEDARIPFGQQLLPGGESEYPAAPATARASIRPRRLSRDTAERTAGASTSTSAISLIRWAIETQPRMTSRYSP